MSWNLIKNNYSTTTLIINNTNANKNNTVSKQWYDI